MSGVYALDAVYKGKILISFAVSRLIEEGKDIK